MQASFEAVASDFTGFFASKLRIVDYNWNSIQRHMHCCGLAILVDQIIGYRIEVKLRIPFEAVFQTGQLSRNSVENLVGQSLGVRTMVPGENLPQSASQI